MRTRYYVLVEALVLHPVMLTMVLQQRALNGEMGTAHMLHQWISVTIMISQYFYLGISFAGLKSKLGRLEQYFLLYFQLLSTIGGCMSMVIRGSSPPCPLDGVKHFHDFNFCKSSPGLIDQETLSAISLIQVLHVEFLPQPLIVSRTRLAIGLAALLLSIFNVFELQRCIAYILNLLLYAGAIAWIHYRESRKKSEKDGYVMTAGVAPEWAHCSQSSDRPRIHFRDIVTSMNANCKEAGAKFG